MGHLMSNLNVIPTKSLATHSKRLKLLLIKRAFCHFALVGSRSFKGIFKGISRPKTKMKAAQWLWSTRLIGVVYFPVLFPGMTQAH